MNYLFSIKNCYPRGKNVSEMAEIKNNTKFNTKNKDDINHKKLGNH